MRAVAAMALCAWGAWAGCYSPSPPQGVPCVDDDHCPSSQKCIGGFCGGTGGGDGGIEIDAAVDGQNLSLCQQWHPEHFDPCAIPMPADIDLGPTFANYSLDTDKPELKGKMGKIVPITTMVLTQTGGPDVLLVSVKNINLPSGVSLTVNGSRPVLFAVWGDATIAGTIDAAAALGAAGPGGSSSFCPGSTGVSGVTGPPGTGGGGGGFQGAGGRGGDLGGLGGAGVGIPTIIRGGCSGGVGGASGAQGARGAGGGAVQISAFTSITIDGSIDVAGGGGGLGSSNYGAAGGGGSGGFIGLDAPAITINGSLTANGGGGGGGGSDVGSGSNGTNGRPNASAASGGLGATTSNIGACAAGGNGAAAAQLTGINGGTSLCAGGGGGGGAGYIVLWTSAPTIGGSAVVSPAASTGP